MTDNTAAKWGEFNRFARTAPSETVTFTLRSSDTKLKCVLRDKDGNAIASGTIDMGSLTGHMQPVEADE